MLRALSMIVPVAALIAMGGYVLGSLLVPAEPSPASLTERRSHTEADAASRVAPAKQPAVTERRVARNVTPPGVHFGPVRLQVPEPAPSPPAAEKPNTRRYHRVVISEAGALTSGETAVRFTGIRAPELGKSCTDAAGHSWPCGRAAATALRKLIRNRAVDCRVVSETPEAIEGACKVGSYEISAWLVENGWAEPAGQDEELAEASDEARRHGRGMFAVTRSAAAQPVALPTPFRPLLPSDAATGPTGTIVEAADDAL